MIALLVLLLLLVGASTWAYSLKLIGGIFWQYCVSVGVFGSYCIISGSPIYDRLLAVASPGGGTSTFLIFVSDCFGYVATVFLILWKTFSQKGPSANILTQYVRSAEVLSMASMVCCMLAYVYFKRHLEGN